MSADSEPKKELLYARFKISDVSADISLIYWISVRVEKISIIDNRLSEKSRKNR